MYSGPNKSLHCFVENRAVARRPPAVCLTAIFAKIVEKRRNPGQTLFGCTVLSCHQEVCLPLFGVPQKMPLVTATRLTPVHPGAMTDSKFVPSNGSSSSSSVRPSVASVPARPRRRRLLLLRPRKATALRYPSTNLRANRP